MISDERSTPRLVCRHSPRCSTPPRPPNTTTTTTNPCLYSACCRLPSSLRGPVAMTAESASSPPSLAERCIGPHKKAFTHLIKRHHNAVRNAQFTHLVLSAAPPPSSLISFRVNLRDSYCVDFSSIHWSRGSIVTLFLVFSSIS